MKKARYNPNTKKRSKRAISIDRAFRTTVTFPNTATGRAKYKTYKGYADLVNFDTKTSDRTMDRYQRVKKRSYQFEKKSGETSDYIDDYALTDSSLTARENKENKRNLYRDTMRMF